MVSVATRAPEEPGSTARPAPVGRRRALGAAIAIGTSISFGGLLLLAPVVWQVLPVTDLPDPFPDPHHRAETLLFLVTFAVLVPGGIVLGNRIADRIERGLRAGVLTAVAALLAGGVALALVITRLLAELPVGGGPGVLATVGVLWCGAAAAVVRAADSDDERTWLDKLATRTDALLLVDAALVAGVIVSFTDVGSLSVPVLVVGIAASVAVVVTVRRVSMPKVSRRVGIAIDAAAILLLVFAVPNLVVLVNDGNLEERFQAVTIQFHQNFFLGPANQILAGDAMLVDVLSQYGVGSIYFLAAAFVALPIGYGTLGLVEGGLSTLMYIGAFATLRIAGVSRLMAMSTLAAAVVLFVYGLEYPLGGLLQHGAIRYGLPVALIVGAVTEARWSAAKKPARALQLVTVGIAFVWALEGFLYTMLTLSAIVAFNAATLAAGRRWRYIRRWILHVAIAAVTAHVLLALGTLAASGSLPDWSWYFQTLREFLGGSIGDWTYDFSSFSWGLLLGGGYVVSAIALVTTMVRRPDLVTRHRTLLLAIAAMTAWGIGLFSYLVNRSADHIIPYVSLPAAALVALWLHVVHRPSFGVSPRGRRLALGGVLALASLFISVAWSSVPDRFSQSALAHVVPGGDSMTQALDRLRDGPVVKGLTFEGAELLDRHLPGEERSIVLTDPDLGIELMLRTGRASAIPFGDPTEDSFVPNGHFEPLGEWVDSLEGGERVLIDRGARAAFDRYRAQPELDPLVDLVMIDEAPAPIASLQRWLLREIGQEWDLEVITSTATGFEVVELVPRDNGE